MKKRIVATMPAISFILFLVSWLVYGKIGLGFSFFLLIPLSTILLSSNMLKRIRQSMPLIALLIFLWLWVGLDLSWAWVAFLLIPLGDIFLDKRIHARKIVTLFVVGVFVTLVLTVESINWHPAWIILFMIPIINGLFFPNDNRFIYINKTGIKNKIHEFMDADDDIYTDI